METAVEVTDDGVGQPSDAQDQPATISAHGALLPPWAGNGLAGLAERVGALNGHLEIGAPREGGFRLKVSVPTVASRPGGPR
jgi:signal transduction histidine kinase